MIASVRMEIAKFFSTRMWWVLLASMAAYMVFLSGVMAYSFVTDTTGELGALTDIQIVKTVYTIAVSLGYVFPVLVGALAVTAEFRHKTIVPTLLFYPSRGRFAASKLVAAIPMGVIFGVCGILAGVAAGAGVLEILGHDSMLGSGEVWRSISLGVLALTIWTVVGVGLGLTLTNQAVVVVVVLAFTQFVEPILRIALPAAMPRAGGDIAAYLPGAAGEALTQGSVYNAISGGGLLPWWAGALVLTGYGVALAAIGRATTLRKDIA
ncbi:ABC transporter permease subunit [Rarobacter faecitabidus]|uniref:ABC-2 family transporter n=1 Tax=Rarobacter faecitabidus TaxID=13243 RepID=A0A542ZU45_RARFA|nr:ABC transporter permease [Rarobacter faecitabidus]TQL63786.1 hypothetical protein FB461_0262 [Rarobacter faecitabidus]